MAAAIAGAGPWTTGPVVVAAGISFVALAPAPAWHLILGIRSSAVSIFVIATFAVVDAPPPVHLATAVAIVIAATAATPCTTRRATLHSVTSLPATFRFHSPLINP